MKKLSGIVTLFIFLLVQIAACQHPVSRSTEEKTNADQQDYNRPNEIWPTNKDESGDYYYSVSLNSFPGYISENAGSYFITNKERVAFLTMENNGTWAYATGAVLNDEYHPVPDSLFVSWFSISENQFYEGTFKLPTDGLKKYFDQMWSTYRPRAMGNEASKHDRFQDLIVGVAPGGAVYVWISAITQRIEVAHYQAKKTQMEWDQFAGINGFGAGSTRQGYVSRRQDEVTYPIPFGKAEKYRTKFIWKPIIESDSLAEVTYINLSMLNGEFESIYHEHQAGLLAVERALPGKIVFNLQIKNKRFYEKRVFLDEDELFNAFQAICTNKNIKAELVLKVDKDNKVSKVVLRNKAQEYDLRSAKVEAYSATYDPHILPLTDH
jgi:hypothetical protein